MYLIFLSNLIFVRPKLKCVVSGVLVIVIQCIIGAGFFITYGQAPHYVINHYTSENGLPQNSIKYLLFDKNGYLWMASESGLIRWDNKEMKVFGLDNIEGLKDERIHELKLDTSGNVFAKNLNGQTIITSPADNFSSPNARLLKELDPYYYPTWGYLNKNPLIGSLWDSVRAISNLPSIRRHASLANGDIYLISFKDIYYITQGYKFLKRWTDYPVANIAVGNQYLMQCWKGGRVAVWNKGNLLRQTRLEGDVLYNEQYLQGEFKTFWCPTGSFVYAGSDLFRIYSEQGHITTKLVLQGISIESPACIYYLPKNNTYYFGSNTEGLYVIKVSDFRIPKIPKATGADNFYTIARLPGDSLIVRNTIIPPQGAAYFKDFSSDYFVASFVDAEGIMYYGLGYSLASYQAKTNKRRTLLPLDEQLVSILPFQTDRLLLCTHASFWIVSKEGKVYKQSRLPIDYDDVMAKGLYPLGGSRYMLLTSQGAKWYNLKTNVIEKSILDSISLRSFYRDTKGRFWFSSDGNGGFMYTKGKLYALPLGPRNALKSIHTFIDDHNGNFWLTTNNGLYKVQIQQLVDYLTKGDVDLHFYALDNKDGLPTNEFNGGADPAYQWLSDGTLVLPSMHGLVEFKPDSLNVLLPEKKIFVDHIQVDSSIIQLTELNEIIELKPSFNQLEIKVSCPYFGNTRNLELVYRIIGEGQKSPWIPVPSSEVINVNRLPAGDYSVAIKKVGYALDENTQQLVLHVAVLPYFYNTWWFYSLILLLFAVSGYIISRQRIATLKRKNLEIERIVAARTAELRHTTDKLEISEIALKRSNKVKEQIIAMVLHDLRSPVRFLGTISKNMIRQFMDRPREDNLDNLKKLHKSIGLLWSFIEQFFAWAVSQQNDFRVKITEVAIQDIFDNVNQFYHEILTYNGNELEIEPSNLIWNTDSDILTLIVRNLLDNANKYTEDGKIWIHTAIVGGKLNILVKDTGRGLNDRQVQYYMDAVNAEHREGNGSMVILQMLRRIGGNLSIQTKMGEGSEFTIVLDELPLPTKDRPAGDRMNEK